MSLVGSRIFFDLLRKGKENLFSFSTFSLGQPYNGQDATLFESHWRRRREQKIVLKAGFFKCHVSLQRGTPTLVSVVAESKQERRGRATFFFSFLYQIFLNFFGSRFSHLFSFLIWKIGNFISFSSSLERRNECEGRQVAIVTWLIGAVRD